jgi:hypothetical protein
MKKLIFLVLILVLAIMLFACDKPIDESSASNTIYSITMSQTDNIVNCEQVNTIKNVYCDNLTSLTFNLYANAYSEDAVNKAYTSELTTYGGIEISNVTIGTIACEYNLSEDNSYLYVTIPATEMDGYVIVDITYAVTLPECDLRMSKCGDCTKLSNFYPQLAVYDENCFREDAFSTIGDPFYSEVADYEVVITVPEENIIASSGSLVSESITDQGKVVKYTANKIRDFALVIDKNFLVTTATVGETEVLYYYYEDESPEATIKYATDALGVFSESYGLYPFATLSIVITDFACGGMEYGRLVYIADDVEDVEGTIVHEIAHQWWYGLVGSDSINEAYLDEGLTCYSTMYYYKKIYGDEKYNECIQENLDSYILYERLQNMRNTEADLSINKSIYDFTSYQYNMLVYRKGCMMFNNLMETMGEEKFNKALSSYVCNYSYRIATTDNLIEELNEEYNSDIGGVLNGWLSTQVKVTAFYA